MFQKLLILFFITFSLFLNNNVAAGKPEDLKKIDLMLKEGYIELNECIKLKTGLLTKELAERSCAKVKNIQPIEKTLNSKKTTSNQLNFNFSKIKEFFNLNSYEIKFPQKWFNFNFVNLSSKDTTGMLFLIVVILILALGISTIKDKINSNSNKRNKVSKSFFNEILLFIKSLLSGFSISSKSFLKKTEKNFKSVSKNTIKSSKNLKSKFEFNTKSLVVPCLLIIIGFLAVDKFGNINFFQKDEYKNVNINSLSKTEKMAYDCVKTYGFKKGTDKFSECVFKLVQNNLEIQRINMEKRIARERLEAQRRASEAASQRAAQEEAELQAQRENALRALEAQKQEQAWDNLFQLGGIIGLELLRQSQPQQPRPSTNTNCYWRYNTLSCTSR